MNYPGNPAISPEVQQRIRSTFEQTLGLAERGSRQEAALGCDFILQLDPQFRPAQALLDRLKATDGGVDVEDLRAELEGRIDRAQREAEAARLFDPDTDPALARGNGNPPAGAGEVADGAAGTGYLDLDTELPDLDDLPELSELEAPLAAPAEAGDADLRGRMEEALGARRFDQVLDLAQRHPDRIQGDVELARLAGLAADRREAGPYVERFLASARKAREAGNLQEAEALEEKARSLDPSHPALGGAAGPDAGTRPGTAGSTAAPGPEALPEGDLPDLDLPELPSMDPAAVEPGADEAPAPFGFGGDDDEGERRIQELLNEGQEAADRADYQGAIDVWSRIFLIDIDHQEASDRIEAARRLKSEQERKVEEIYQEALRAAERGDADEARNGLEEVLRLVPSHAAAAEQLDRLDAGEELGAPTAGGSAAPSSGTGAAPSRPSAAPPPLAAPAEADLKEEILVPPEPGEERPAHAPELPHKKTMVATRSTPPNFVLIGVVVLVLVLVGGYLLYANRDSLFPNVEPTPAEAAQVDPIDRATRLHESGKTDMAMALLRRLPPTSAQYEEAQALLSQWEAADQPAAVPVGEEAPPEPEVSQEERQAELLTAAAAAASAGENLRASALLDQAEDLGTLPPGSDALRAEVDSATAPFRRQVDLLEMGEYGRAIPDLWRLHNQDPANPDLRHLLSRAYYNIAVRSLQQGDTETAVEHLEEAAGLEPADEELQRQLAFARTYESREKDLLYRIYVKYLPAR